MGKEKTPRKQGGITQAKKLHVADENFLPPDLVDDRISQGNDKWQDDDEEKVIGVSIIRITEPPGGQYVLGAPDWFYIVSQTVRSTPGGGQVVDVLLEIEDKPGVVEYEVRITKPTGQI
jgi:hypothetical protein